MAEITIPQPGLREAWVTAGRRGPELCIIELSPRQGDREETERMKELADGARAAAGSALCWVCVGGAGGEHSKVTIL